jgi:hypothetical protein
MTLDDAEGFAAQPDIQPLASIDRPVVAVPEQWQTVGHLYRGIEAGLARLCGRYGEDAVFIGPPDAQAVTATFEWKELTAVTDLASAGAAIELIVEQGEGARGDWVKSHFGRFTAILEDFLTTQAADPGFEAVRPVEPAYVQLPPDLASGTPALSEALGEWCSPPPGEAPPALMRGSEDDEPTFCLRDRQPLPAGAGALRVETHEGRRHAHR